MNCLDSSFVIDFLDPDAENHDAADGWMREHTDEPLLVPYICAFEVLRGAARANGGYERAKSFLRSRSVDVESSGLTEAVAAAEFDAELHERGTPLSARDTLVASCAHRTGYTLVTRDRDFEGVPVEVDFYV
jgi:predicted nucleic acid-binding protein